MQVNAHKLNHRDRRRRGFTFVEILVVVIIIGVLAAMIIPMFLGRVGAAKQSVAKQKLTAIEQAVQMFNYDYGRFPQVLEELVLRPSDIDDERWNPPTIKAKDLTDPWGHEFVYQFPGDNGVFDLISLGADGQQGGEGENADVTNW
jgi:general secretion pathway protein G